MLFYLTAVKNTSKKGNLLSTTICLVLEVEKIIDAANVVFGIKKILC